MEVTMVFAIGVLAVRIGMLVAGVLFCWFGYRLFAQTSSHGNAEVSVKDTLKLNFQHVGPGVFFSLFGAAILVYNIHKAPVFEASDLVVNPTTAQPGLVPAVKSSTSIAGARPDSPILDDNASLLQAREQIAFINRLTSSGAVTPSDQVDFARLTRGIKLSLMRPIWRTSWGEYVEFEAWALDPGSRVPNEAAREIFARQ